MGWLDFLPKIGAGGLMYPPGMQPQVPQSDIFTRPLIPILEKLGLGKAPNIVKSGNGSANNEARAVSIYSHPVGGALGGFVEQLLSPGKGGVYDLGPHAQSPPDPRRHWAVQVGDIFHELNADHNLNVVYQNGRVDQSDYNWERFTVGWTKYDDEAIRQAGEKVIAKMRPVYDIYDNNCQKFTIDLLNIICEPGREKVITSYSYLTQTKMGVEIPFLSNACEAQHTHEVDLPPRDEALAKALSVMGEQTPRVDPRDIGTVGVHHESGEPVLVHLR